MPTLEYELQTEDGRRGWIGEWFAHEDDNSMTPVEKPMRTQFMNETRMFIRYSCYLCSRNETTNPGVVALPIRMESPNVGHSGSGAD